MNHKWLGIAAWMMFLPVLAHADGGDLGGVIVVSREAQVASGIRIAALDAAQHRPTVRVYGFIESLAPLIRMAEQAAVWQARLATDQARAVRVNSEYRRLALLFRDQQNVARKRVEGALAAKIAADAAVRRARQELQAVTALARLQWGPVLGPGVVSGRGPLSALLAGKSALLEVNVPLSTALSTAPRSVQVLAPTGGAPVTAWLLSAAPVVTPGIQGQAYFYQLKAPWTQTGLGVTALMPISRTVASGVVVPEDAVVWYGNQSWVYLRVAGTQFRRTPVRLGPRTAQGWFIGSGLSPHDEVVVAGAQLLLSQELLAQSSGGGGDD